MYKEKLKKIINEKLLSLDKLAVIYFALDNLELAFSNDMHVKRRFINKLKIKTIDAKFSNEEIITIFFSVDDVVVKDGKINNVSNFIMQKTRFMTQDGSKRFDILSGTDGIRPAVQPICNMDWCLTCGLVGNNFNCEAGCKPTISGCGWFNSQECTKLCR
ncbi:hypothetical protein CMU93_13435 [Elizabethkingia anophelis]|nr:hypothetical protein [Elizabethkingia anophelis]